jgi:hypothetical protein
VADRKGGAPMLEYRALGGLSVVDGGDELG